MGEIQRVCEREKGGEKERWRERERVKSNQAKKSEKNVVSKQSVFAAYRKENKLKEGTSRHDHWVIFS